MKMEMNKKGFGIGRSVSGYFLLMALTLFLLCPLPAKATITPSGTLSIKASQQMTSGLYYQFKATENGFYKFTSSAQDNEVYMYSSPLDDEYDYDRSFEESMTHFMSADTTYYFKSESNTSMTVATVPISELAIGNSDQIMFSGNYYVIIPKKTSDYVITLTSVSTFEQSPDASLYDDNLDWITEAKTEKDKPSTLECLLKANKKYYLSGSNAKVSIQVGALGNERDSLLASVAVANAEKKAAIANGTAPAKVALKSLKPGKKSLLIKWGKAKKISGYELQYGLNKKFTKGEVLVKVKASKISKKIKNLKSKKKYFVRIRAYRNIKGGTIYGNWSKVRVKKVK